MGSKKLKALAIRGGTSRRMPIADPDGLKEVHKGYSEAIKNSPFHKGLTAAGTGGGTSFLLSIGDCPTNNWATTGTDSLPTCNKLDSANMDVYKVRPYACHTCSIRCGAIIEVKEGPFATKDETHRPEYETLAAFGPLCRNDNLESVIKANEYCNRVGIDTISVGGTIAFAIECFENGIITKEDTGGVELTWGNAEAIVEMTRQMAFREGFGAVLADGSKVAAQRIGKGSEQFAMNVGGRELPLHDPRMAPAQGTIYCSDSQPANHMNYVAAVALEQGSPLGPDPALQSDAKELFGEWDKKGDYYARGNAYYQLLSSAGLCNLYAHFYAPPVVELLRPVTGWDMDWEEGLETGRRILTMRQIFNVRQGVTPDAFRLPKRFETALSAGPAAGQSIPFDELKAGYFAAMGWDIATGRPNDEVLERLGLAGMM
jgi:aldehyde:ferredoxin oxidoreductase